MIDVLYIYILCAVACGWGFILFIWWWQKTKKATEVFKFITILLLAEFVEKTTFSVLRIWNLSGGHNELALEKYKAVFFSWWWPLVTAPTTIAFTLIVGAMTIRVFKSYRAYRRPADVIRPKGEVSRSVLVISAVDQTRQFMKGLFVSNGIKYNQAKDFLHGLEILIMEDEVPVVMIGLSAIEDAGLTQRDVVTMVKKERPWAVVVAMTREPNMYELFETRRAFFDDYLHLPAHPQFVIRCYNRWVNRINRWRSIEHRERRIRRGQIGDRRNITVRKT